MDGVMTVRGAVPAGELGHTLTHEHIFVNMLIEYREVGLLNDFPLMVEEVRAFAGAGGRTIVEVSTAEMTRGAAPDPAGSISGRKGASHPRDGARSEASVRSLVELSELTELNVVIGTGHYRDPYFDGGWFDRTSTAEMADLMIRDITEGIGDTGVRAGVIGEVGADKWYLSAAEERSLRAASRAQKATGVTITTHAARWPVGIPQLDLFEEEGVDLRRVVIGHCDSVNVADYHLEIARRGAFVQFDTVRGNTEYDTQLRIGFIKNLASAGYLHRVLLSHDICRRSQLHIHNGGGYDYIPTVFSKRLREAGLSDEEIHIIFIENPRRALTGTNE